MNFKKIALVTGVAVSGISVSSVFTSAQAITLNVGGKNYDVTTISTSYNASTALLQEQPWWTGTADTPNSLADQFATAALTANTNPPPPPYSSSNPPNWIVNTSYSPFFLFQPTTNCTTTATACAIAYTVYGYNGYPDFVLDSNTKYEYAVLSSTVVPEPLNILGSITSIALLGTVSRSLKRRKVSK